MLQLIIHVINFDYIYLTFTIILIYMCTFAIYNKYYFSYRQKNTTQMFNNHANNPSISLDRGWKKKSHQWERIIVKRKESFSSTSIFLTCLSHIVAHMYQSPAAINIAAITIKFRRRSVFFPRGGTYFAHYILCIGLHRNDDARVYYK